PLRGVAPQVDIRPVRLIPPLNGSVDDEVQAAILVDVTESERLKLCARSGELYRASAEITLAIAMVDVDPPALEGRHQVELTVSIEIADDQGPTRHDSSRAAFGERNVASSSPFHRRRTPRCP